MNHDHRHGLHLGRPSGYRLKALALAPLLLAQGFWVRLRTPRLPEPPGARSGESGQGPGLRLLILGDSAAAGVGAPTQELALSGALARELAGDFRLSWRLLARTGLRTRDALPLLDELASQAFDVALCSFGVNDVTSGTRARAFASGQRDLIERLRDRFGVRLVLLTELPPMHAFPALPQPLRHVLGQRALAFSGELEAVAASDTACTVVRAELPVDPSFAASDGFHPSPGAYRLWAFEAARVIRQKMAPGD